MLLQANVFPWWRNNELVSIFSAVALPCFAAGTSTAMNRENALEFILQITYSYIYIYMPLLPTSSSWIHVGVGGCMAWSLSINILILSSIGATLPNLLFFNLKNESLVFFFMSYFAWAKIERDFTRRLSWRSFYCFWNIRRERSHGWCYYVRKGVHTIKSSGSFGV